MITNNIFLYHLDYEMHKLFHIRATYSQQTIYNCFKLITRLAYLLSTESIIIPASNYFESDIAFRIINELAPLNEFGVLKLTSSSLTLEDLLAKKSIQHSSPSQHYHYDDFRNQDRETPLYLPGSLIKRERSASTDIRQAWLESIGKGSDWANLYKTMRRNVSIDGFESVMYSVPDLLEDKAFISEYILPFLPLDEPKVRIADTILNYFITQRYVESFLVEYDAMCFSNIPLIDSKRILPNSNDHSRYIPYNKYAEKLYAVSIKDMPLKEYITQCSALDLIALKNSDLWGNVVQQVEDSILHTDLKHTRTFTIPGISTLHDEGETPMNKTLIITALQLELDHILENFQLPFQIEHIEKDNRHYYVLHPNTETTIVCTAILGMGQVNAALAIKDALSYMTFDRVILAGICGGLYEKLQMGDIVVSEKIVDYEIAKVLDNERIIRWNVYNSDYTIINQMKSFSSERWRSQLTQLTITGYSPSVFFGTVLSGNKVMASREDAKSLSAVWDKALAIEMEGSGIANALYQTPNAPPFMMVKSVCDLADQNKNDDWQVIAAKTAAVFVIDFVLSQRGTPKVESTDYSFSFDKNILFVLKECYNLSELNELCFNLGIDIEDLRGDGRSEKAVELIKYCKRRNKLQTLIAQINQDRNGILSQTN